MNKIEYFFYEWLIVDKHIDEEKFKKLSSDELKKLKEEFIKFYNSSL